MLCKIRVDIFFLCFSALAFLLVACGSSSSNSGAGNNPSTSSNNPPSQPRIIGEPGRKRRDEFRRRQFVGRIIRWRHDTCFNRRSICICRRH